MTIFARIDHAAGAAKVGKKQRSTEVLIFGNPQGGTPFMECNQTVGIDLPLKALVWEDASGQVWLGYNDPAFLVQRHGYRVPGRGKPEEGAFRLCSSNCISVIREENPSYPVIFKTGGQACRS